jgi:hypothetical protein
VGSFGLGQLSELVKQWNLVRCKLPEAARFSHGQFRFVVEAFHNT